MKHKMSDPVTMSYLGSCPKGTCRDHDKDVALSSQRPTTADGHPRCSCGEVGPHLYSQADRISWFSSHKANPGSQINERDISGKNYGTAGKSLGSDSAVARFGKQNTVAGAIGERHLEGMIKNDPELNLYDMWTSLRIPSTRGQKRYSSDVDFALANGRSLVLVDCKMWSAGKFYWSLGGKVMEGLGVKSDKPSRNMEMAVARYQDALPGHKVSGMVVFVPTKRGLPMSVGLLFWPGGIRSYMPSGAARRIKSLLGSREATSPKIQAVLGRMTR